MATRRFSHPSLHCFLALAVFVSYSRLLSRSLRPSTLEPERGGDVVDGRVATEDPWSSTGGASRSREDLWPLKGARGSEEAAPASDSWARDEEGAGCGRRFSGSKEDGEDGRRSSTSAGDSWRELSMRLARLPAKALVETLETTDPFGVREFQRQLEKLASQRQGSRAVTKAAKLNAAAATATVTLEEIRQLFPCPNAPACRLAKVLDPASLPGPTAFRTRQAWLRDAELRNATSAAEGEGRLGPAAPHNHTWVFFQHLRKAGGTHFCSLAKKHVRPANLTRPYLCAPDGIFNRRRFGAQRPPAGTDPIDTHNAGSLGKFTNEQLVEDMSGDGGYPVGGNEWNVFEPRFLDLPAAFVTTFREPVDRAFSQFLFECVTMGGAAKGAGPCAHPGERGGQTAAYVLEWWRRRTDLHNIYLRTFTPDHSLKHPELHNIYASQPSKGVGAMSSEIAEYRAAMVGGAYDVLQRFHLVMVMEWLPHARSMLKEVLGWNVEEKNLLNPRRIHGKMGRNETVQRLEQAIRNETARIRSDPALHDSIREFLALDMILNDVARRMFLERLVCT